MMEPRQAGSGTEAGASRGANLRVVECVPPRNWAALDVQSDDDRQLDVCVRRLTAEFTAAIEAEKTHGNVAGPAHAIRAHVRSQLSEQIAGLRAHGAELLLMEADPVAGVRTGMAMTIFPMPVESGTDPLDVLLAIAARTPGSAVFESGSLVVLRTREVSDPRAALLEQVTAAAGLFGDGLGGAEQKVKDTPMNRLGVTYYFGDPDLPHEWHVALASVVLPDVPEVQELGESLVAVCDAVVRSVRLR